MPYPVARIQRGDRWQRGGPRFGARSGQPGAIDLTKIREAEKGVGEASDLLLRQVSAGRAGAEGADDYDVIGADGLVIGRIFKATTAPAGTPWL